MWQPIETAPRDGTRVLIFGDTLFDKGVITVARFGDYRCPVGVVEKDVWMFESDPDYDGSAMPGNPSHWQPLPAPPA